MYRGTASYQTATFVQEFWLATPVPPHVKILDLPGSADGLNTYDYQTLAEAAGFYYVELGKSDRVGSAPHGRGSILVGRGKLSR